MKLSFLSRLSAFLVWNIVKLSSSFDEVNNVYMPIVRHRPSEN
jgi:hypothetical protein